MRLSAALFAPFGALLCSGCWTLASLVELVDVDTPLSAPVFADGSYCIWDRYDADRRIDFAAAGALRDCLEIVWDAEAQGHLVVSDDGPGPERSPLGVLAVESGLVMIQIDATRSPGATDTPHLYAFGAVGASGFAMAPPPDRSDLLASIDDLGGDMRLLLDTVGALVVESGSRTDILALYEEATYASLADVAEDDTFLIEGGPAYFLRVDDPSVPLSADEAEAAVEPLANALRVAAERLAARDGRE